MTDLPTALRAYAGDGSIEPVDAPASLLLRAADVIDAVREDLAAEDALAEVVRSPVWYTDAAAWARVTARARVGVARKALETLLAAAPGGER